HLRLKLLSLITIIFCGRNIPLALENLARSVRRSACVAEPCNKCLAVVALHKSTVIETTGEIAICSIDDAHHHLALKHASIKNSDRLGLVVDAQYPQPIRHSSDTRAGPIRRVGLPFWRLTESATGCLVLSNHIGQHRFEGEDKCHQTGG